MSRLLPCGFPCLLRGAGLTATQSLNCQGQEVAVTWAANSKLEAEPEHLPRGVGHESRAY